MRLSFLAIAASVALLAVPAEGASESQLGHAISPQNLSVEHAEILVPGRDGAAAEGYLTIWNGTVSQTGLIEVRSTTFARVSILRTEFREGEPKALPVEGVLPIPGRAELRMRHDGVRLMMEEPISASAQQIAGRLTLVFEGGQEVNVVADVVPTRAALTRHHHGEGDVGAN